MRGPSGSDSVKNVDSPGWDSRQARGASLTRLPPQPPPEFQQVIPRGRIASIDAPEFVAAKDAEISDDAWVLGVEIGGEAKAYSLNLLNHHEVVNDRLGEQSFAAVW